MLEGKYGPVAVICADHMRAVITAHELRMSGIATETFLSGNLKKQFAKAYAGNFEALVIVRDDGNHVKELVYNIQRKIDGPIVLAVMDAIDNWEPSPCPPERRYVTTTAILLALVAMFSFAQWMG